MKAITLANHLTEPELEDRIHGERDASIRDRYRALLWILQGEKRGEIARRLGVSGTIIREWVERYNSEGDEVFIGSQGKVGKGL